jgi:hypothetical protein
MTEATSAMRSGIEIAVESVRRGHPDAFAAAVAGFAKLDVAALGIVQAGAVRSLLEQLHPDGLDAEDVREVLTACARAAAWFVDFSPDLVLLVLSGALGMTDPDQQPLTGRVPLAAHACLVLEHLSAPTSEPSEPTGPTDLLARHLADAVAEIRRAETMEMP